MSRHLPESLPAWSMPTTDAPVGVDYLGTRQANLDMLGELTGVYNNQVQSARQHAILAWAAWRFRENIRHKESVEVAEFRDFLDVVETIQLVGQHELAFELGQPAGGLGRESWPHFQGGASVPLRFGDYRSAETSALAAVQYGPSARPAGLGFLTAGPVPMPTARGERLAAALDIALRGAPAYRRLTEDPPPATMDRADVLDLARRGLVLSRAGIPRPEIPAYVDALFGFDGRQAGDRRAETLALLLHLVGVAAASPGLADTDIRTFLASWRPAAHPMPTALEESAARWQIFLVRQQQRLALEAWQAVVERRMNRGPRDVRGFLDDIETAVAGDPALQEQWGRSAASAVASFGDPLDWEASGAPWDLARAFRAGLRSGDLDATARATLSLWLGSSAALLGVCPDAGPRHRFAATGSRLRVSMTEYKRWWRRRQGWTVREVLGELLDEFVLQQHVGVAVSRFDNRRRRLRFCFGEEGWSLLPGTNADSYLPDFTRDRLPAALALLHDVGLVALVVGANAAATPRYSLTADGRATLDRFLQTQEAGDASGA